MSHFDTKPTPYFTRSEYVLMAVYVGGLMLLWWAP